jgi:uncharacterized protein GlcG (DUF336 family)
MCATNNSTSHIKTVKNDYSCMLALLSCVLLTPAALAQNSDDVLISAEAAKKTLNQNIISVAAAEKVAKACVGYAEGLGKLIGIYILSPSGSVVYAYRMDGQTKVAAESAFRKAKSALDMRMATHRLEGFPPQMQTGLYELDQFPFRGGLPIMLGDQIIGAVGVGGMTGDEDEECAHKAISDVVGPQPPLIVD